MAGVGAATAAVLLTAGFVTFGQEEPVVTTTAAEPTVTYRGNYEVFKPGTTTVSIAPPLPGEKDAAPATTKPPVTTTKAPVTPTKVPVTTTKPPIALPPVVPCLSNGFDGVQPHVARVGHHIQDRFAVAKVGGVAGRGRESDHPGGLALDFMVDTAKGDEITAYLLDNMAKFDVSYVIWKQRINFGNGWTDMEDRGSITENHFDHVHVSFVAGGNAAPTC